MSTIPSVLFITVTCFVSLLPAYTSAQCTTTVNIESLNKSVINTRIAHIEGSMAKIFVALDPIWSLPDFENMSYRSAEEMKLISHDYEHIMAQDFNEIVIWDFRSPKGAAIAIPFKKGCAVMGYGEPDDIQKITIMRETLILISEHGIDSVHVRNSIEKLLLASYYVPSVNDKMINIMLEKVRQVKND